MTQDERTPDSTDLPEGTAAENPAGERTSMDHELEPSEDPLERHEEQAAASEAGRLGGPAPEYAGDEERQAVEEAGGGVAEGFEESERDLIEGASHGDQRYDPETDAFTPEEEADRATSVYSEPDEVDPTEVVRDPREEDDDPGAGPGLAPER